MAGSNFVTMGPVPDADGAFLQSTNLNQSGISNTPATVVAALSGKRIFVHALVLGVYGNTGQINFIDTSTAGSTVATPLGPLALTNNISPFVLPYCQYPWFTIAPGDALGISCPNATISTSGRVLYVQG